MSVAATTRTLESAVLDRERFFVPEEFTPLFHTAFYAQLSHAERLRYNQLVGLVYNEQFIFFESTLSDSLLAPLLQRVADADFAAAIRKFRAEEIAHAAMFHALNRCYAPEWYSHRRLHFIRMPAGVMRAWSFCARRPAWFPFILWLVMILEERGTYLSAGVETQRDRLEPHMVDAYRTHCDDEATHVDYDLMLLDRYWTRNRAWIRRLNARIFERVFIEYFTVPKRTGLRVLDTWIESFPAWRSRRDELAAALVALKDSPSYINSLYGRDVIPRSRRHVATQPDFQRATRLRSLLCLGTEDAR